MVRTGMDSGSDTDADIGAGPGTGNAGRSADLRAGLLTAARRCGALMLTVLLSLRTWWRRRRRRTRTVVATAAMILASSTVSLLLGLSTATASAPVGPHEATWSTTLDSTVTLDLGPLGTASMESPAGILGVKVVLGEIPGDPAPDAASAASVGQSLSSDAASYLSLVSHPDLTIRQGLYGLAGDALRRAGVVETIFLCCVAAWRLAPTKPWRETVRAGASHRWATTVAVSAAVATAASLLVPAMRTVNPHGSTLSALEGTPLARARFSGRIADVVTAYGPKARSFVESNKDFYAKADTNLRAAWRAAEQTEGLVDVTAADGKVNTEELQARLKTTSAKTVVKAGAEPTPTEAPRPLQGPSVSTAPSASSTPSATAPPVTGARSVPERGRKTAVLTTDLHCNLDVIAFSGVLDQLSGADVHMDDGDLTMTGSGPERVCVDALTQAVPSSTDKVATIGNHDSDATAARLRSQGWTVTDGSVQTVAGITVLGDDDAERTTTAGTKPRGGETTEQIATRLAKVSCGRTPVDVVLIHQPATFDPLMKEGCAPLLLAGHVHAERGMTTAISPRTGRPVSGVISGAGKGGTSLGSVTEDAFLHVMSFDSTGALVAWRAVILHPDASVTVGAWRSVPGIASGQKTATMASTPSPSASATTEQTQTGAATQSPSQPEAGAAP
ncbi:serine/threonine protein phosphatase [Actinomyces naeslundii]|uniref:Serine/threonine protein phosphatase n=2 Tax=Actinomyces naeslundii TaxID=1655 RepID=A0AA47FH78_ACTNA|nr:serine/threonine protein phosphatase [Actinomyces naeslundii]OMG17109.1 serine/threonine protein phosphatase [Actinomyces naeslundii]PKY94865.1 serine/threonine protein phosphatase [Actinomyces naeslundii]WAL42509.1 serine/threonine protein phosphatase [Actinomyces naeslundii]